MRFKPQITGILTLKFALTDTRLTQNAN